MSNEIRMTQEGYDKLVEELNLLKSVKRNEISEKIRVARGFGDLSENSEYDEAKNEQAVMEARITQLEEQVKNATIISADEIRTDVASVGTKVKILDIEFNEELEYRIVGTVESHQSDDNTITDESPVGKALLGHKAGETVTVHAPAGEMKFKILGIGL